MSFPTLLDSEESGFPASNEYGISSVPTMFLVESRGESGAVVSHVIEGWNQKEIDACVVGAGARLWVNRLYGKSLLQDLRGAIHIAAAKLHLLHAFTEV